MEAIYWTSPSGAYLLRGDEHGRWDWYIKCCHGQWQRLYGTYPPASVIEEFAKHCYSSLQQARRGLAA